MKNPMWKGGAIGLALLVAPWAMPSAGLAETRYVNDVLVINLRAAPRDGSETIGHLRTGDAMEVLEAQGSFLKVRTEDGEVGWVLQQYTDRDLPKARVIANLRAEVARLEKRAQEAEEAQQQLEARLDRTQQSATAETSELEQALTEARQEARDNAEKYQQVQQQYQDLLAKSEQVIEITEERDRLLEENQRLGEELGQLTDEVASLTRSTAARWFLAGGGVFFLGWVVGSTSRKKKGKYSVG